MEVMLQIRAAENRDGDDDTTKKRKEMMENEEDNVMLPTHRNDDVIQKVALLMLYSILVLGWSLRKFY